MTTLKSILEIDPSIIRSNIQKLRSKTSNTSNFLAVIKSDAYGHMLNNIVSCLLYTSPSPRDPKTSRMPSSA